MHRFYAPNIKSDFTLPQDEAHHCVKVLRLGVGDEIEVVDGDGGLYLCRVASDNPKHCLVEIVSEKHEKPHWQHRIVLSVAPTKNIDRMEWMAEKVTEMGVDEIIPLLCDNSERRVLKTERLRKILVSAMKQSLKSTLPVLRELTPLAGVLSEARSFSGQKFIAYCDPSLPRAERVNFFNRYAAGSDVMLMVGPEGDFSPEEVKSALEAGFEPVTLGESRLRTETAAVMCCAACHVADTRCQSPEYEKETKI
ncbi:MAG: 16S rRNA (uracil(1498)-N(3))-methyltransferase [Muribaculaceae bacterium]|nr:16S rRNA (uracil(1498)-N(3))-methyltransferase [Muribaculaceae bacterium]